MSSPFVHPYERKIVKDSDNLLIESICPLCGFHIVGSATHNLKEDEDHHAATCPHKQAQQDTARH